MGLNEFLTQQSTRKEPNIAVILPSRGLIFAEVEEAVEKERNSHNIKVYRTHNLPIPECINAATEAALAEKHYDYFWFVEEE